MGIESQIDQVYLILLATVLLIATGSSINNTLSEIVPGKRILLVILRILALLSLLLILVKPYYTTQDPDKNGIRVIALADVSGSMRQIDKRDNVHRIDLIKSALDTTNKKSWINQLRQSFPVEIYCFAKDLIPFNPGVWDWPDRGKPTALGHSLFQVLDLPGNQPNSVVLLSDGNNNRGRSVFDITKEFQKRGIPVNVIGIGDATNRGDLEVTFEKKELKSIIREEVDIKGFIKNSFSKQMTTRASLWHNGNVLETLSVTVPSKGKSEVHFSVKPEIKGIETYKITITAPTEERNRENNVDRLLLSVVEADQLRVLYLSDKLQFNYKFLKNSLQKNDRFEFSSIVKLGKSRFHRVGKNLPKGYPQKADFWHKFDVIFLNSGVLRELKRPVMDGLKNFVSKRGGGLLVFGELVESIDSIGGLLPVRKTKKTIFKSDRQLEIHSEPIFSPEDNIFDMELYTPGKLPFNTSTKASISARPVSYTKRDKRPILTIQAYGAGRTAYWGTNHDWIWAMASDERNQDYNNFWYAVTNWLGSGGTERVSIVSKKLSYSTDTPVVLSIDVLGKNFNSSTDAIVEAVITSHSGKNKNIQLFPQSEEPGRYQAVFRPSEVGGHEVKYRVLFPDNEVLENETFFNVFFSQEENINTEFNEGDLKKIAHLTKGKYFHYQNIEQARDIALSDDLPIHKTRHYPTEHPVFVLFIVCVLGFEWIIRRQGGFK